jgi:hypothetical protein
MHQPPSDHPTTTALLVRARHHQVDKNAQKLGALHSFHHEHLHHTHRRHHSRDGGGGAYGGADMDESSGSESEDERPRDVDDTTSGAPRLKGMAEE